MSDNTKIEWADATVNAVNGCSVLSPGCTNCYAMRLAGTRLREHPSRAGLTQPSKAGPVWTGEVRLNEQQLLQPLRWRRPRRIFWNAHGDLFHDAVPDEWIDRVFAICALTPQHTHMILTKRPARMRRYMAGFDDQLGGPIEGLRGALVEGTAQSIWHDRTGDDTVDEWLAVHLPLPNVWLGASIEDQQRADERIPDLLATPAAKRFISAEPLLGPIDLTSVRRFPGRADKEFVDALGGNCWTNQSGLPNPDPSWAKPGMPFSDGGRGLDWLIVGGESGLGARPMHPDWARSLCDQCEAAGVAFFFKQWGEWKPFAGWHDGVSAYSDASGTYSSDRIKKLDDKHYAARVGKRAAGRLLDGREHSEFPA